jgi:2-dehydro-3-deoxyphosphogalactonate aldolase
MLKETINKFGLIAILRGLCPEEALDVASTLFQAGFRLIEIPLNSPEAFASIRKIRDGIPEDCIVGAGTVYQLTQVRAVRDAGGTLIVMPHGDRAIIEAALSLHLDVLPGVATATEAFSVFSSGATLLKVFPADQLGSAVIRAWRAVLPKDVGLVPVGGIDVGNLAEFCSAGALGFGIGSSLFRPGISSAALSMRAKELVESWQMAHSLRPIETGSIFPKVEKS